MFTSNYIGGSKLAHSLIEVNGRSHYRNRDTVREYGRRLIKVVDPLLSEFRTALNWPDLWPSTFDNQCWKRTDISGERGRSHHRNHENGSSSIKIIGPLLSEFWTTLIFCKFDRLLSIVNFALSSILPNFSSVLNQTPKIVKPKLDHFVRIRI